LNEEILLDYSDSLIPVTQVYQQLSDPNCLVCGIINLQTYSGQVGEKHSEIGDYLRHQTVFLNSNFHRHTLTCDENSHSVL
jgi:hypothetical protein